MTKIKLYSIGNEGEFNYYLFDKNQKIAELLSKIIKETLNLNWDFIEEYFNKKGKWVSKKKNIERNKDVHEAILGVVGKKERVDIFYGNKKMFIAVHCSQKDRLKFNEKLSKIFSMPKPKKFKPLEK